MATKTCAICGKPSGMYPLCKDCFKLRDNGEVVQCPDCKTWHLTKNPCECKKKQTDDKPKKIDEERQKINTSSCILCGKESNGYLFCKECFHNYSNKTITVSITNCSTFEIIDEYGNRKYKTCNGLFVRSTQEKIIYDELFKRKIRCEYEKTFTYKDENGEIKTLKPDFYLIDYDLYIEHWGYADSKDPNYQKTKQYKEKIYSSKNLRVAGTSAKDIEDISSAIDRILLEFDIEVN